jgi:hypothetical protein
VVRPYGNTVPTVAEPHFTGTVTISEPDGDYLGGDADPSTSARFVTEVEWIFTAKPVMVTEVVAATDWTRQITITSAVPATGSVLDLDNPTDVTLYGTNFDLIGALYFGRSTTFQYNVTADFTLVSSTELTTTLASGNDYVSNSSWFNADGPESMAFYFEYVPQATHHGNLVESALRFTYPYPPAGG